MKREYRLRKNLFLDEAIPLHDRHIQHLVIQQKLIDVRPRLIPCIGVVQARVWSDEPHPFDDGGLIKAGRKVATCCWITQHGGIEAHGQRWPSQVITSLCVPQGRNGRSSRVRINRSKGKQGRTTQDPCNLVAFNTGHALARRIVPRVSSVSALFRQPDEIYRRVTSRHVNIICIPVFYHLWKKI